MTLSSYVLIIIILLPPLLADTTLLHVYMYKFVAPSSPILWCLTHLFHIAVRTVPADTDRWSDQPCWCSDLRSDMGWLNIHWHLKEEKYKQNIHSWMIEQLIIHDIMEWILTSLSIFVIKIQSVPTLGNIHKKCSCLWKIYP